MDIGAEYRAAWEVPSGSRGSHRTPEFERRPRRRGAEQGSRCHQGLLWLKASGAGESAGPPRSQAYGLCGGLGKQVAALAQVYDDSWARGALTALVSATAARLALTAAARARVPAARPQGLGAAVAGVAPMGGALAVRVLVRNEDDGKEDVGETSGPPSR